MNEILSETLSETDPFDSEFQAISISAKSDISSAFIYDDKYFQEIQNEILEQGKTIETFIRGRSARKNASETFRILQTLFALFKSSLSMNINLRKLIVKSKYIISQEMDESKKAKRMIIDFIKTASNVSNTQFNSLNSIINFIMKKIK